MADGLPFLLLLFVLFCVLERVERLALVRRGLGGRAVHFRGSAVTLLLLPL